MAFTAKCPKCKQEAALAFTIDLAQKVINCSCGNIAPALGLSFNPNPEFLFKYRPHDCYSESWILKEELFFSSPAMFNDPFDSKVMYSNEGTLDQKKKYLCRLFEKMHPGIKKKKKWELVNKSLKDQILEKDHDNHIIRIQQKIDGLGVVSFSRKPDDLLMFSYYAKDHTGYCLKYRRSSDNVLSMAQVVNYEENYPKFSIYDLASEKIGVVGDKVLYTKANCWKHEDEWRISFSNFTRIAVKSFHPILEGIILGCKMKPEQRNEIISLNKRRAKPVAMLEARKKKFEFALEIIPVSL
jgi:hypothetical protein